jgi:hypothetical protein
MKSLKYHRPNKKNLTLIIFLLLFASFFSFAEANAQSRRGHSGRGRTGSFYFSHNPVHFDARIGTRIRVLPFGYLPLWFGGIPYYYYDGIYYQYFPGDGVYMVVNKPAGADKVQNIKFDQVKLYDGSTLEGVFEGATDSTITLRIADKDHDINIGNVVSITFAPSIKDTTKQK